MNIWGKPAENFAMLANRGQEIFVEASLEEVWRVWSLID
jgi:hypothetical protein